jgi:hypothetical protein
MLPNADAATQLARIEQLIEQYREDKRRQLLRRALKLWRKNEADWRRATRTSTDLRLTAAVAALASAVRRETES